MYLIENGSTDKFYQYECKNISQVKNIINKVTKTNSITDDWKEICYSAKKESGSLNFDYIYFNNEDEECDCSVNIGYDANMRTYIVWFECE